MKEIYSLTYHQYCLWHKHKECALLWSMQLMKTWLNWENAHYLTQLIQPCCCWCLVVKKSSTTSASVVCWGSKSASDRVVTTMLWSMISTNAQCLNSLRRRAQKWFHRSAPHWNELLVMYCTCSLHAASRCTYKLTFRPHNWSHKWCKCRNGSK